MWTFQKKHKCKSSIFRTLNDSRAMHFYSTQKGASTFEKVSPIPLPFKQKRRLSRNVTNRRKKADYPDRKCQSKLIIPDKQNYFSLPPKKIDLSDNERMKRTAESSTDQVSKLAINFYNQPRVCFFFASDNSSSCSLINKP